MYRIWSGALGSAQSTNDSGTTAEGQHANELMKPTRTTTTSSSNDPDTTTEQDHHDSDEVHRRSDVSHTRHPYNEEHDDDTATEDHRPGINEVHRIDHVLSQPRDSHDEAYVSNDDLNAKQSANLKEQQHKVDDKIFQQRQSPVQRNAAIASSPSSSATLQSDSTLTDQATERPSTDHDAQSESLSSSASDHTGGSPATSIDREGSLSDETVRYILLLHSLIQDDPIFQKYIANKPEIQDALDLSRTLKDISGIHAPNLADYTDSDQVEKQLHELSETKNQPTRGKCRVGPNYRVPEVTSGFNKGHSLHRFGKDMSVYADTDVEHASILKMVIQKFYPAADPKNPQTTTFNDIVDKLRTLKNGERNAVFAIMHTFTHAIKLCALHSGWSSDSDTNRELAAPFTLVRVVLPFPNTASNTDTRSHDLIAGGGIQKDRIVLAADGHATDVHIYSITSGNLDFIRSKPKDERHKYVQILSFREYKHLSQTGSLPRHRFVVIKNFRHLEDNFPSYLCLVAITRPLHALMKAYWGEDNTRGAEMMPQSRLLFVAWASAVQELDNAELRAVANITNTRDLDKLEHETRKFCKEHQGPFSKSESLREVKIDIDAAESALRKLKEKEYELQREEEYDRNSDRFHGRKRRHSTEFGQSDAKRFRTSDRQPSWHNESPAMNQTHQYSGYHPGGTMANDFYNDPQQPYASNFAPHQQGDYYRPYRNRDEGHRRWRTELDENISSGQHAFHTTPDQPRGYTGILDSTAGIRLQSSAAAGGAQPSDTARIPHEIARGHRLPNTGSGNYLNAGGRRKQR